MDQINNQYDSDKNQAIPPPKKFNKSQSSDIEIQKLKKEYQLLNKQYNRLLIEANTLRKTVAKLENESKKTNKEFNNFKRAMQIDVRNLAKEIDKLKSNQPSKQSSILPKRN